MNGAPYTPKSTVLVQNPGRTCLACKYSHLAPKEMGAPPAVRICFGMPPTVFVTHVQAPGGKVAMQNTTARPIVMPDDPWCSLGTPRLEVTS